MAEKTTKKVFISYSWVVQQKVIELSERLLANGVDVVLDVYDLKEGQDKYVFMEQCVNDENIDRVLIICDKTYTEKANRRSGGVGDETVIISQEVYGNSKQEKFIPIIFEVNERGNAYCPTYFKAGIYIDLSTDDDKYESEYERLLRNIFEKPLYKKPVLGNKPKWLENDVVDLSAVRDIVKQIRGNKVGNSTKTNFLLKKAEDEFSIAAQQYFDAKIIINSETILKIIEQLKPFKDLFVDYLEAAIYSDLKLYDISTSLLENLFNKLHDATGKDCYSEKDFELQNFLLWELFISLATVCLHFEKYKDLRNVLEHTYFLKESYWGNTLEEYNYTKFRPNCSSVEAAYNEHYKIDRCLSPMAKILVTREKKPILTKESISNADIVLYQLYPFLNLKAKGRGNWFPLSYIYHNGRQNIWIKLKSKKYCESVLPLFCAQNLNELISIIKYCPKPKKIIYESAFQAAPLISDSVNLDEIGALA